MKIKDLTNEFVYRNNKRMNESFVIPYNNYLKIIAPAIKKINEATLTADQINQIFAAVEQGATAAGGNRTLLGKGKDKAQELINKILPPEKKAEFEKSLPAADAGPVQGFEQQAQAAIGQVEDPKAKKSLMDLIKQGIKNPVTQTLLMTAITGIAGVVAGPAIASLGLTGIAASTAIGAVVGGLSGVVRAKMGGADWATAGKAGLKGAGMGAAAGAVGGTVATLGQAALDAYQQHQQQQATAGEVVQPVQPTQQDLRGAQLSVGQALPGGEKISALGGNNPNTPVTIERPDGSTYTVSRDTAQQMTGQTGISNQATSGAPVFQGAGGAEDFSGTATPQQQKAADDAIYQQAKAAGATGSTTSQSFSGPGAKNQAFSQVRGLKQSYVNPKPMLEYIDRQQTFLNWALNESLGKPRGGVHLTEAGIKDMMGKAANWLATKGKNLTTKITADKLMQAWKKAGSKTDSEQVATVLASAGVAPDIIASTYKAAGIPAPTATAPTPSADLGAIGNVSPSDDAKNAGTEPAANPVKSGPPGFDYSTAAKMAGVTPANTTTGAASDQTIPSGPIAKDASTGAAPTPTSAAPTDSTAAPTSAAPTASAAGGTPAGTAPAASPTRRQDASVQDKLIKGFNALTPQEQDEIEQALINSIKAAKSATNPATAVA